MAKKRNAAKERQMLQTAEWWKSFKETNNDAFLPLLWDQHRYLVLRGGGGSGKSIFVGRLILERVTSEPGHRWLVIRKVAKTLRRSCFDQLVSQANEFYAWAGPRHKESDMTISFKNGSQILFAGIDDPEKLKSIFDITGIWIEEASELDEGDFNQLDIRLRTDFPYPLQMYITFNPISIKHWLKRRFWDTKDERATTHESTYKDNRFLIPEAVKTLEKFKETDPYYYMVYCLNQWGVTGKTVFDAGAISERLKHLRKPRMQGRFIYTDNGLTLSNIKWLEEEDGPIKIWDLPNKGQPYVIGGDTAGGTLTGDGKDYFVGQVVDNVTGKQVAILRQLTDEDLYARQMFCLGMYYNTALLAVEVNFSTYPVKELQRLGYPKQFIRQREDTYREQTEKAYGFRTDPITRPVILSQLIAIMRDNYDLIEDEDTLLEMLTFVREPKKLRMEAEPGAHDDCVMALAITYYARGQQDMEPEREQKTSKWTESMWEDYYNTDEAGRNYLIAKWGLPK